MNDMTLNEYQLLAARTINPKLTEAEIEQHALYGLASETGEVLGLWQKQLQGHEIDDGHFLKEVGDVLWMLAELLTVDGHTLEEAARLNIDKLRARYPNGFDTEHSIHRDPDDI
jgi:NTP pyrophosphatase (non-canonical NTP hydrolase)